MYLTMAGVICISVTVMQCNILLEHIVQCDRDGGLSGGGGGGGGSPGKQKMKIEESFWPCFFVNEKITSHQIGHTEAPGKCEHGHSLVVTFKGEPI